MQNSLVYKGSAAPLIDTYKDNITTQILDVEFDRVNRSVTVGGVWLASSEERGGHDNFDGRQEFIANATAEIAADIRDPTPGLIERTVPVITRFVCCNG
jgi:hypothetical protein